jgi:hypothetical protein
MPHLPLRAGMRAPSIVLSMAAGGQFAGHRTERERVARGCGRGSRLEMSLLNVSYQDLADAAWPLQR